MIYDIIYSLPVHQDIKIVNNLLENINKFNKNNKFCIILHLNEKLYKIRDQIYKKNVLINDIKYNKKRGTMDLLKCNLDNFEYLIKNNINFYNFMIITSSVRFVRQSPHFEKPNYICKLKELDRDQDYNKILKSNWYSDVLKNKHLIDIIKKNKIELIGGDMIIKQNEGRIYAKEHYQNIYNFIKKNEIIKNITHQTYFEETLLPSLSSYFNNGKNMDNYCHVFWEFSGKKCARPPIWKGDNRIIYYQVPNVELIKDTLENNDSIFIIKRIPDDINDPVYKYVDNLPT